MILLVRLGFSESAGVHLQIGIDAMSELRDKAKRSSTTPINVEELRYVSPKVTRETREIRIQTCILKGTEPREHGIQSTAFDLSPPDFSDYSSIRSILKVTGRNPSVQQLMAVALAFTHGNPCPNMTIITSRWMSAHAQ
jgi:hypothetical protein